jgi:mRNA interferase HigB
MRVHLIKKQTIQRFVNGHQSGKSSFENWLTLIKYSDWHSPRDIQLTFGSADLLGQGSNRVVFDIGGNNYRIICKYHFGNNYIHLFICWIGHHSDYDVLCRQEKQYSVNTY